MAGEVIVDALPYIDQGYDDPGVRESALAMVEEECRRYRPTKNYLEHLPPLSTSIFETKLMAQEFERIQNLIPMETLSMKRYELPPPSGSRLSEVSAWEESIDNSKAQLEHQWVRAMNLELMLDYGIEAWKAYLEVFVAMQAKAQVQLQELKKEIQDVNWQRKQAQTKAGEKLRQLEASWVLLVSKNYEIEQQCVELEKQILELRKRIAEKEVSEECETESDQQQVAEHHVDKEVEEDTDKGKQTETETEETKIQSEAHEEDNDVEMKSAEDEEQ
ncbi:pre-mRNA-splicing factor SPF27 [Musca vetustissima]|uniref:pre-mRNA-splicing factor SPF27 n=1 Tax=Musca vetustissima TaxID=27455 RepID=UPI002AB68FC6|nr:pre-mRNA-splicing factor SPF27 [Musca vetustissima]